ncbi:DUF1559 family PulG-like putative transporter [Crateriforma spongiae]|uniref:DUF1559 family PulG-like putative transporter n=1 Tax=Crateriforma spongiae TaxID=2724528 RepID=UPI0014463873|nr:DUF1559 domain-containing protein [Crateriforma spongiae]
MKSTSTQSESWPPIRGGRSVGEVVFVLFLIALIVALAIPWMLQSRQRSRRIICQTHLQRIATALGSYHSTFGHYPSGTFDESSAVCNDPTGFHHNWLTGLIARMDHPELAESIDRSASIYSSSNAAVLQTIVPELRCPAFDGLPDNVTSYAGNQGSVETPIAPDNNGVLMANVFLDADDVRDGLEYTVFVGEKLPLPDDHGWASGTRSSIRNGGHSINVSKTLVPGDDVTTTLGVVGGFGSDHVDGAHVLLGSGRWSFVADNIDLTTLRQMTDRADAQVPE